MKQLWAALFSKISVVLCHRLITVSITKIAYVIGRVPIRYFLQVNFRDISPG